MDLKGKGTISQQKLAAELSMIPRWHGRGRTCHSEEAGNQGRGGPLVEVYLLYIRVCVSTTCPGIPVCEFPWGGENGTCHIPGTRAPGKSVYRLTDRFSSRDRRTNHEDGDRAALYSLGF